MEVAVLVLYLLSSADSYTYLPGLSIQLKSIGKRVSAFMG